MSIEQMEHIQKEFITTPTAINQLLRLIPETVMTTFDIAHVPLNEKPEDYYDNIQRINKIHLSDSSKTQFHLPLGEGEIEWHYIINKLEGSDLPIVIEGFENNRSLSLLRKNVYF